MKMPSIPMSIIKWNRIPATRHSGDTGFALWRTQMFGDIRVRIVEYSPGYSADHWCSKGHVLFCLSGSLQVELQNGQSFSLVSDQSYHVGDDCSPHRSHTSEGATLFIVD
jgi:hypothetical protein